MKIQALNVYPIKALRPIQLDSAVLTPQGIRHDRTFMLFKVNDDASLVKLQLSRFPQCALFSQEIVRGPGSTTDSDSDNDATILVRYHTPSPPLVPHHPLQTTALSVPLVPDTSALDPVSVDLHGSPAAALRMGSRFDAFFSACFGFPTMLVHIGSGRRPVLGSLAPPKPSSLLSSIASYLPFSSSSPSSTSDTAPWLTFTDCAPLLVTSTSSLSHPAFSPLVASESEPPCRLMPKFRPNIVLHDPAEEPFAEDFWAELVLPASASSSSSSSSGSAVSLLLTANCGRCSSLNVDYATGRPSRHPDGKLLNALMGDRRVDPGHKYAPVFGRYAFLSAPGSVRVRVRVGEEVVVARRNETRTVFDWPFGAPATANSTAAA
ncbi:Mitochondrial amidoxime-reducing component 1 [Colletotrichum trifolii]|uniref:Mitochondrial amidoxime-reducing component 1 n=1 Tax=Colletotrichum trifolii TaxID=5466 RepID=A0A4R8RGT2_COLTR|nr:Mitochondrial amidoxime-reducing component 1 [Colletotrichum trifolii]